MIQTLISWDNTQIFVEIKIKLSLTKTNGSCHSMTVPGENKYFCFMTVVVRLFSVMITNLAMYMELVRI